MEAKTQGLISSVRGRQRLTGFPFSRPARQVAAQASSSLAHARLPVHSHFLRDTLVVQIVCTGDRSTAENVSYSEARAHLAELWDRALSNREAIMLTRRGKEPVVLVAADEYEGLLETAHLLRSPANAVRLLAALEQALAGEGEPQTLRELRANLDSARAP